MKTPALCPLDGRYGGRLGALRSVMSEAAFTASRVRAELAWFEVLSHLKLPRFAVLSAQEIICCPCRSRIWKLSAP